MSSNITSIDNAEMEPATVNPALIDSLGVQVDAFIGKSSIKISELNSWKVGCIVKLDASLSDLVELRVNGLCVAGGELVSVGEQFGVRVTSVVA